MRFGARMPSTGAVALEGRSRVRLLRSRERLAGRGGPRKRVVLHIGAPKTGSTFLQQVLWHHREALAETGIGYPFDDAREHFVATLDLREMTWGGGRDPAWAGAWDRVAGRAREWPGHTVVISNELLGGATPAQITRAAESLEPAEIRVVFTARDLVRQLPSDWQEQVKHTHAISFDEFTDDLIAKGLAAREPFGPMFWGLHDPMQVLPPWASAVGTGNVYVVTVPQAGAPRDTLWRRFASVLELDDPGAWDLDVVRANPSLGAVEAELLRRTNERADRIQPRRYREDLRGELIERVLRERPDQAPIAVPERHHDWLRKRSRELIEGVRAAGYTVVGDLADLEPATVPAGARAPGEVDDAALLDAALDALAGLLVEPDADPEQPPA
jgi:hypothetical protein